MLFFSDYYKRTIAVPFLDGFLMQLETRFASDSRPIQAILSLVPFVVTSLDDAACSSLVEDLHFWDKDPPSSVSLKANLGLETYN